MKGDVHWLKEVKEGGRVIILDDESIWEIPPSQAGDTCTWDLVSGISISTGKNPAFPFRLINTGIDEGVDARHRGIRSNQKAPAVPVLQRSAASSSVGSPA